MTLVSSPVLLSSRIYDSSKNKREDESKGKQQTFHPTYMLGLSTTT